MTGLLRDPFPTCLIGHRDRDGHGLIVTPGGRDTFIGDDVRPNPVVIVCRFQLLDRGRDADFPRSRSRPVAKTLVPTCLIALRDRDRMTIKVTITPIGWDRSPRRDDHGVTVTA